MSNLLPSSPFENRRTLRSRRNETTAPQDWSLSPLRHYHMEQEPWVYVPPSLVEAAADANAGLLLAYLAGRLERYDPETTGPRRGIRVIDGTPWLAKSVAALVAQTGLTETRVKRALIRLQNRGLVERAGRLQLLRPTQPFQVRGVRGAKVYGGFVRLSGDAAPALILAQLNYWFSPGKSQSVRVRVKRNRMWWWACTYEDLARQTGLTVRRVRTAVNYLRSRRLITTSVHRFAGVSMLHLRFDYAHFRRAWEEQCTVWWESQAEQRNVGHVEL